MQENNKVCNMKSSPYLLQFYEWWLEQEDTNFSKKHYGLCTCLVDFLYNIAWIKDVENVANLQASVREEMKEQFKKEGLNHLHPFNTDFSHYFTETELGIAHLNTERVQWVIDRIRDMEEYNG